MASSVLSVRELAQACTACGVSHVQLREPWLVLLPWLMPALACLHVRMGGVEFCVCLTTLFAQCLDNGCGFAVCRHTHSSSRQMTRASAPCVYNTNEV